MVAHNNYRHSQPPPSPTMAAHAQANGPHDYYSPSNRPSYPPHPGRIDRRSPHAPPMNGYGPPQPNFNTCAEPIPLPPLPPPPPPQQQSSQEAGPSFHHQSPNIKPLPNRYIANSNSNLPPREIYSPNNTNFHPNRPIVSTSPRSGPPNNPQSGSPPPVPPAPPKWNSWLRPPEPIVIKIPKRRPPSPPQPLYPNSSVMAHARPLGPRRVYVPPPQFRNEHGTMGGTSVYAGGQSQTRNEIVPYVDTGHPNHYQQEPSPLPSPEGFSCYYGGRHTGQYVAGGGNDLRPVELRDDESTPLPWERRPPSDIHVERGGDQMTREGASTNSDGRSSDDLPPEILQTTLQYDDEEFAVACHRVRDQIEKMEVKVMDARVNRLMDEVDGKHSPNDLDEDVPNLADRMGKPFISAFLLALEHRFQQDQNDQESNYNISPERMDMLDLVMDMKEVVGKNAAYFVMKETKVEESKEGSRFIRPKLDFVPHADQDVAGFVPFASRIESADRKKGTTRGENNEEDEKSVALSIAKSFEHASNSLKSTVKHLTGSKTLSKGDTKQNVDVKTTNKPSDEYKGPSKAEPVIAIGRYVNNEDFDDAPESQGKGSAKLIGQTKKKQEIISEIDRLQQFISIGGMHGDDVQRSCNKRIKELQTELEALTQAAMHEKDAEKSKPRSARDDTSKPRYSSAKNGNRRKENKKKNGWKKKNIEDDDEDSKRDRIIAKIETYENKMAKATNRTLKASCRKRILDLQDELADLDGTTTSIFDDLDDIFDDEISEGWDTASDYSALSARNMQKQSIERQEVMKDIKRVMSMMLSTSNEDVKEECQERLEDLRHELDILNQDTYDDDDSFIEEASFTSYGSFLESPSVSDYSVSSHQMTGKNARMVKVQAPANLPGGYKFSATLSNGQEFVATVPAKGVKKGKIFMSPVSLIDDASPRKATRRRTTTYKKDKPQDCVIM